MLLALVAVGCAALRYAGEVWYVLVSGVALLTLIAAIILAVIERGEVQAAAIGLVVSMTTYGLVFVLTESELPSYRINRALYWRVVTETYIDRITGQPIPASAATSASIVQRSPDYEPFQAVAHVLWALSLGYAGSRFALWAYRRRVGRNQR